MEQISSRSRNQDASAGRIRRNDHVVFVWILNLASVRRGGEQRVLQTDEDRKIRLICTLHSGVVNDDSISMGLEVL